jgi:hypothetical protein
MSDYKPGDRIMVKVGGVEYETVIDQYGTQRFVANPDHWLVKQIPIVWDTYLKKNIQDMNTMYYRYKNGEFSQRDYAEMNMAVGYSVSGFCDLSNFNDMIVENPLWASEDDNEYTNMIDSYLLKMLCQNKMTLSEAIEVIQKRDGLTKAEAENHFVGNFLSEW